MCSGSFSLAGDAIEFGPEGLGGSFGDGDGSANTTKTVSYTYDKVGNRLTRTEAPVGGVAGGQTLTTTYTYDDNDQLLQETKTDGTSIIYGAEGYDANGNLIQEKRYTGNVLQSTVKRWFTFEGKITREETYPGASMAWSKRVVYNYDGEGNRIGMTHTDGSNNWTKNEYLVDTSQPYAEVIQEVETYGTGTSVTTNGLLYRYDIGLDRLRVNRYSIQANAPNPTLTLLTTAWYVFDGLGSTRALVSGAGVVSDGFGYEDAFGKPYSLSNVGMALTGFFLNGQQWDGYENLYFNRARYYQPTTGRFIGQDPYEGNDYEPNTLHRYFYVANNPVNKIDPSGNYTCAEIMTVVFNILRISGGIYTALNITGVLHPEAANAPTGQPGEVSIPRTPLWEDVGYVLWEEVGGKIIAKGLSGTARLLAKIFKGCFVAGTIVQTEHGTKKIEEVSTGDKVWSLNVKTKKASLSEVTGITQNVVNRIVYLTYESKGKMEMIAGTVDHPMMRPDGKIVNLGDVKIGDRFLSKNGTIVLAKSVEIKDFPEGVYVYNLSVKDDHTYFVGTLEGGIWVHNTNCFPPALTEKLGEIFAQYHPRSGQCAEGAVEAYKAIKKAQPNIELEPIAIVDDAPVMRLKDGSQIGENHFHMVLKSGDRYFDAVTGPAGATWSEYVKLFSPETGPFLRRITKDTLSQTPRIPYYRDLYLSDFIEQWFNKFE